MLNGGPKCCELPLTFVPRYLAQGLTESIDCVQSLKYWAYGYQSRAEGTIAILQLFID